MTPPRLDARTLAGVPSSIARPAFERDRLGIGIVHLGLGGFHRAHQAVFTEDAIVAAGGDWGIAGAALQRPDAPDALEAQDNLYTLEILGEEPRHRVMGVLKRSLYARRDASALLALIAAPTTHVVTVTVTEKGYTLDGAGGLDANHPDILHDLAAPAAPRSLVGWVAAGLAARRKAGGGPLSVISCDNVSDNGGKLGRAVRAFAEAAHAGLPAWIDDRACFPNTMVDSITPAATDASRARVAAALGLADACAVQREPFSQWVIEDRFAGPRPAWEAAGVEIVADAAPYERMKLHVLNATHSALAYLGLPRGLSYVREAIADPEIAGFVDALVAEEIAPALAPMDIAQYWRAVRARFANPMISFPLTQIAEDGSVKLGQRVFPLLIANARAGRPAARLAGLVKAWLAFASTSAVKDPQLSRLRAWRAAGGDLAAALADEALFPSPFRSERSVRAALEIAP